MAAPAKAKPSTDDGAEGAAPAGKKLAGKQLVLFVALPALLLIGGGGTAAMLLMKPKPEGEQHASADGEKKDKKDKKEKDKKAEGGHGKGGKEAAEGGPVITEGDGVYFVTLPDMLVNVATADGRPAFLKLKLTIEAPDEATVEAITPELPRVLDQFQAFLRELRVDDLAGSAGSYRLRLELLRRVNIAVAPAKVNAVLIEEMLIQ